MENKAKNAVMLRKELAKKDADSAASAAAAKTLSARQLITSVLDAGTFAEIGAYVKRAPDSDRLQACVCFCTGFLPYEGCV